MRWTLSRKVVFALLVVVFSIPILIMSYVPELFIIVLFGILLGCFSWYVIGRATPHLARFYFRVHQRLFSRSPDTREIAFIENQDHHIGDYWVKFYRALVESFFPTIVAFSIMGYILRNAGSVNDPKVFLVLLFAPAIVSFLIPIKILRDSKLYYLDKSNKEVISLCRELYIRLKSYGGILALGLFLFTLYSVSGGLEGVVTNLLVYFSFIYPSITLTFFVYFDRWHEVFVDRTDEKGRLEGLETFVIALKRR